MSNLILGMVFHGEYPTHPRIENQALHLISEGVEVHLFCVSYNKETTGKELHKGIHIHRYYLPSWMYKMSALAYTISIYHRLIKPKIQEFIADSKADVIHLHNMYLAQPVFELNDKFNLPVVLDLHENVPEIMKFYPHIQKGIGKYIINPNTWKRKEEQFIIACSKVIVVTNDAKLEIEQRTEIDTKKTLILPNFTNPSFIKIEYNQQLSDRFKDYFKVLYIGDTGNRRGIESVIKAIPIIIEEIPHFKLIVVGSSRNDGELFDLAKKMNVLEYVSFEGWQQEERLPDYIHLCDIGICPLLRNIHHDTTYANKLFQYAAHGKPILASDCTSQKHLIESEKWGLVHEANNGNDFTQQLIKLYKDPQLRSQLGTNGADSIQSKYNFISSAFGKRFYLALLD